MKEIDLRKCKKVRERRKSKLEGGTRRNRQEQTERIEIEDRERERESE